MKKLLLIGLVFLSMTGFAVAQDHHSVHHPVHHPHHRGHHRPVHHHPVRH
jgi:Spy/CpxP family protein refolding chaperone